MLRIFKDALPFERSTNLDVKGTKKSVKMWASKLYKGFPKDVYITGTAGCQKICSLHTYFMHRMVYFEWYCTLALHSYTSTTLF